MEDTKQDYYAILGVPKTATQDEIRSRYWDLAKFYHPDTQTDLTTKRLAEEEMAKITEAYKTLSDTEKRKQYDASFSTSTTIAKRAVGVAAAIHGALTGPAMGRYVHNVESTVPWDFNKLKSDVGDIVKAGKFQNPMMQPPKKADTTEKQKKPKSKKQSKKIDDSTLSILKNRYAKGEITKEQYLEIKKELR
jgi:DnaJ-class molecular chaperone